MRMMISKGLLLVSCIALASLSHAPADAMLVTAMLMAVTVSGLAGWLSASRLTFLPTTMFVLLAVFSHDFRLFLPLIAFDMARAPLPDDGTDAVWRGAVMHATRLDRLFLTMARWLWLAPLIPVAVEARSGGGIASAVMTVSMTCAGFLLGADSRDVTVLRGLLRGTEDRLRESSRSARLRMADVDEERAQSVRMATLGERTRIARDIHDNVGHLLTRAIMQAQAGNAVAEAVGDDAAARGFAALGETLDGAMTMVRRSVHDLEDDGTDFVAQIEDAAHSFDSPTGSEAGLVVRLENDVTSAPAPVSRCLATVIRESLANVAHHSEAHEARVTLRDFPAFWQLAVTDPGPAAATGNTSSNSTSTVSPSASAVSHATAGGDGDLPPHGMGLADIESRVRALGGNATCGPYDGGWRVFVSLPKARWHVNGTGNRNQGKAGRDDHRDRG